MNQPVHIVALGARTPVGLTAESAAAAVRARVSRLGEHPCERGEHGELLRCARDSLLPPARLGRERLTELGRSAVAEVIAKLTQKGTLREPVTLLLALPEKRPGHSPMDATAVAAALTDASWPGLPRLQVERAGEGHAGGLYALERGVAAIAQGQTELCLVGGVDSYFGAGTFRWLQSERRLAGSGGTRSGFPPGEGAGMLALASHPARLGLPSLAVVREVATGSEPGSLDSDEGLLGHGLTAVVHRASAGLSTHEQIDGVYCDINGERHRTDEWSFTLLRLGSRFRDATDYISAAGEWGDVGAATGVLGCILAVQAFRRGYARGPRALVWGSSWGGLRGAALLQGCRAYE